MTLKNVWHRYHPAQSKRSKLEVRGFAAEEKVSFFCLLDSRAYNEPSFGIGLLLSTNL
ncbi:hypothetical protein DPMN_129090 [Dreissena polymorpha]|uniref:Uncharacterized protein n=1 Tax=Dreissena polymorpha TaxID=45954 RepID=A0A9D4H0L1_DREPO|nr:hypothetical protein DPMN_129090 [Dreissena polymorpha]